MTGPCLNKHHGFCQALCDSLAEHSTHSARCPTFSDTNVEMWALCFTDGLCSLANLPALILSGFENTERNDQNCLLGHKYNSVCLLQTMP